MGGGEQSVSAGGSQSGGASGGSRNGSSQGGTAIGGLPDGGASGAGGDEGAPVGPTFVDVPTQHNDNGRTGANLSERELDPSNVKASSFGELSRRPLRGAVFGQPLVVTNVTLPNGQTADIVYVATMANEVFALDARAPERPALWVQSLGPSIVLRGDASDPIAPGVGQIWHEIGVMGTPVAVPDRDALYLASVTREGDASVHRVHKLSLRTGDVSKSVTVEGTGFVSSAQAQASALTFSDGTLYVPFGGYDPNNGATGFVFLYDAELTPLGFVSLGSTDGGGGVTMSGQGLVATAGRAFFTTNPSTSTAVGSRLLELKAGAADASERFFPYASSHSLSNELGHSGPLLVPNSDRLLLAGQHRFYVVNPRATNPAESLVQEFRASGSGACSDVDFACAPRPTPPVFWSSGEESSRSRVFVWSPSDVLRSFGFDAATGRIDCPAPDTTCTALASAAPGDSDDNLNHVLEGSAQLSLSANGGQPGSGIVWATHAYSLDTLRSPDGIVRAYDAERLRLLWSSETAAAPFGPIAPTTTATVSGGRVFVATADGISSKQTFWDDWTVGTPALTSFGDEYLVVAWPTSPAPNRDRGLQIAWSADGVHFADASSLYDTIYPYDPALASDGESRIFLAYTTNSTAVKVAVSNRPDFFERTEMLVRSGAGATSALSLSATTAPALTYGNGRLFLAFNDDGAISVISSSDGVAFDWETRVVIPNQPSYAAPALAYQGGRLYLVTANFDHQMSLYVSNDQGAHFEGPAQLPTMSWGHPAFMWSNPENSREPDVQLIWADAPVGTRGRIKVMNAARGDLQAFSRPHEFTPEEADGSISATRFRGAWHFAWMGVGDQTHPNVARYTSGELVTYGLGGH